MTRAGIVTHFEHVCRRRGCEHRENAPDDSTLRYPAHRDKLWPKPHVLPIRFHDLRHTTASLLLQAGVPIVVAQKVLRHRPRPRF